MCCGPDIGGTMRLWCAWDGGLQASVRETQDNMGHMVDNKGGKARIDMQEATVRQLKKVLVTTRHDHAGDAAHPEVRCGAPSPAPGAACSGGPVLEHMP